MTAATREIVGCHRCGRAECLVATIDSGEKLCVRCWTAAGRPWPRKMGSDVEIANQEQEVRRVMDRRGGADKYRVHAGKT
jgi:hypothetical protein